ncbi:MAG: hypothetical protein H7276_18150, partial [Caulobacter sp.]|nr:hypothetical protein [Vitreoscilla sp.]
MHDLALIAHHPADPVRRRLLRAAAAGAVLALPGAAVLAQQREGVQVGRRSHFESLVPAAEIEAE